MVSIAARLTAMTMYFDIEIVPQLRHFTPGFVLSHFVASNIWIIGS